MRRRWVLNVRQVHTPCLDPCVLLEQAAARYPDNEAVICDGRRQTYAELRERASRLAHGLRDQGIIPGDRVALLCDNAFETLEQIVALAVGGYVRCGLYTH